METILNTVPQFPQQLKPAECENPELRFDRYQFAGKRKDTKTLDGRKLGYLLSDGMHFQRRSQLRARRWIPEWAMSEEKLRQVIARRATNWAKGPHTPAPSGLPELRKMCDEKLARLKAKRYTNPRRLETFSAHLETAA